MARPILPFEDAKMRIGSFRIWQSIEDFFARAGYGKICERELGFSSIREHRMGDQCAALAGAIRTAGAGL